MTVSTWRGAVDSNWDTAGNWDTGVVPNGSGDVAIFNGAPLPPPPPPTNITFTAGRDAGVGSLRFDAGNYIFQINAMKFTLDGLGANAGIQGTAFPQGFNMRGGSTFTFANDASAGTRNEFRIDDASQVIFNDSASAGNMTGFQLNDTSQLVFNDASLANDASIFLNGASVVFNQSTNSTFSGVIFGPGSLVKDNTSTLSLTGNSPFFIGTTTVKGGTLSLEGSLPESHVLVNTGATLMGTGTAFDGNIEGTISPGSSTSTGTFTFVNDFTIEPTGMYMALLETNGSSDLISVGHSAHLDGTLNVNLAPGSELSTQPYTILTAAHGIVGTFKNTILNGLNVTVNYLTDKIQIVANSRNRASSACDSLNGMCSPQNTGLSGATQSSSSSVAGGAQATVKSVGVQMQQHRTNRTVGSSKSRDEKESLDQPRLARFNQLVSNHASRDFASYHRTMPEDISFRKNGKQRGVGLNFAMRNTGDLPASGLQVNQRVTTKNATLWIQPYGQLNKISPGSNCGVSLSSKMRGLVVGGDYQICPNTFLGLLGGYSRTDVKVSTNNMLSFPTFTLFNNRGNGHINSIFGGLYGSWLAPSGFYVDG